MCREWHAINVSAIEGKMRGGKMEIKQYPKEKIQLVRDYDILKCTYLHEWCSGFAWQGFTTGRATRVGPVRSCEKLPPCPIEPMPAGSKTDPLLAKAKPINNGGSASVITYLRRGKTAAEREE